MSLDNYYSDYFQYRDGVLYCEDKKVEDINTWLHDTHVVPTTPFFLFSKAQLVSNVQSYMTAFKRLKRRAYLNYALKANMNPSLVKIMKDVGCSLTLVSGLELRLALQLGFEPERLLLNGNGKQTWEIDLAVEVGCLLNIDSVFNLKQTIAVCSRRQQTARVLLRVNPNIELDSGVHQYNCTGNSRSKFGLQNEDIQTILDLVRSNRYIDLVGLHCHLGSTITDINVFRCSAKVVLSMFKEIRSAGFDNMVYINLGGGLGISYRKHANKTATGNLNGGDLSSCPDIPSAADVVDAIEDVLAAERVTLILEPGRSLVGNAGVLVTSVLGVKEGKDLSYIVVDGAMTDVIRPALYDAYHHIDLAQPTTESTCGKRLYHVVGPVCESGDFLGKDRYLSTPHEGCLLTVFDVGAYCGSMASNYNMRPRAAEVLVDGSTCRLIRQPDTLETMLAPYQCEGQSGQ